MTLTTRMRGPWTVLVASDDSRTPLAYVGDASGDDEASRTLRGAVERAREALALAGASSSVAERRAIVERAMRPT